MEIVLLLVSVGLILSSAYIFTNGVEWLGCKLNLCRGAVGSVLAAVGTALPESVIPVIAILFGGGEAAREDIGIGAILGAPFMLGTLALFLSGFTVLLLKKGRRDYPAMRIDAKVMARDQKFFLLVYSLAILAAFLPKVLRFPLAAGLLLLYLIYVWQTFRGQDAEEEGIELEPLFFCRKSKEPGLGLVFLQVGVALAILISGASIFVDKIAVLAHNLGVPAFILALIITPLATELPEKCNSVIWLIQGKDTLALGNITGAMVFQSSILPAIGIALTDWVLTKGALISAGLTLATILFVYLQLRWKGRLTAHVLMVGGIFYLAFLGIVFTGVIC